MGISSIKSINSGNTSFINGLFLISELLILVNSDIEAGILMLGFTSLVYDFIGFPSINKYAEISIIESDS